MAVGISKQVPLLISTKLSRDKETGADFPVSAKQDSRNNGILAYKVNSLMMVLLATTETLPKMNYVRTLELLSVYCAPSSYFR